MPDLLNPPPNKSYADRPLTPFGMHTGFTETKTNPNSDNQPAHPKQDPYQYQPAYFWSHPATYLLQTSNYLKALAARIPRSGRSTPTEGQNVGIRENGGPKGSVKPVEGVKNQDGKEA